MWVALVGWLPSPIEHPLLVGWARVLGRSSEDCSSYGVASGMSAAAEHQEHNFFEAYWPGISAAAGNSSALPSTGPPSTAVALEDDDAEWMRAQKQARRQRDGKGGPGNGHCGRGGQGGGQGGMQKKRDRKIKNPTLRCW